MKQNDPDLRFGYGMNKGFTAVGVATFDNLRPAAVVRELIQNSLDAAREAGVRPARVQFRLTTKSKDDIPGIKNYKKVFRRAIAYQKNATGGQLPGQANLIKTRIQSALRQEHLDVLTVLDNGVGLNEWRMNALLSDGVSAKADNATGTYGNGHATAIPASDLRYILYGGVAKEGPKIGAGHAVLASHHKKGEEQVRSADGFYVRGFQAGNGTLFAFATGDDLPNLIADATGEIESAGSHGAAVIIPAFNNFLETKSLWEMVSHAASANFFAAIEEGDLEVTVQDLRPNGPSSNGNRTLDSATLQSVLDAHKHEKRAAAFLNGRRAFDAHHAYRAGKRHIVPTSAGDVEIRLLENLSGVPRVDLCRNGMWITDDKKIPGFYQKFSDKVPFRAILSLNAPNAQEECDLHKYIRIAEGPLHDSIAIKRLLPKQRKACRKALNEILQWILKKTKNQNSEAFVADDFLVLDFGDDSGKGAGKSQRGFWGVPVPVLTRTGARRGQFQDNPVPGPGPPPHPPGPPVPPNPNPKPPSPNPSKPRPALPTHFQAVSRPVGTNRQQIVIECSTDFKDAELRLVVDEALDATCERRGQDPYAPAALGSITINGKAVTDPNLVFWNGGVIGVRLGNLEAGKSVEVETDYVLTGDFTGLAKPSLRVEVLKYEQQVTETT